MADEQYLIEVEEPDTEGHVIRPGRFTPEGDDEWVQRVLREPGSARVHIRAADDEDDTEGHRARAATAVRVMVETDDDTEGHAISIHFPSLEEADAFRRRLVATGLIVGTVAIGAGLGTAVGGALGDQGSAGAPVAATRVSGEYAADRGVGMAPDAAMGAQSGGGEYAADRGVGVAPEAPAAASTGGTEYAADRGAGVAPEAAAGAQSGGTEYAADRGAGIAPDAAGPADEDTSSNAQDSRLGPTPR